MILAQRFSSIGSILAACEYLARFWFSAGRLAWNGRLACLLSALHDFDPAPLFEHSSSSDEIRVEVEPQMHDKQRFNYDSCYEFLTHVVSCTAPVIRLLLVEANGFCRGCLVHLTPQQPHSPCNATGPFGRHKIQL